jgi:protein-tyrosine phosphatase
MPVVSLSTLNAINKIICIRKFGENIPNASEIMPRVFIGDATAAMEAEENGFTAIVNCAPSDVLTNREYYPDHISYMDCRMDDLLLSALPRTVETFIDHALDTGRKVLIHCTSGINVSAMVATAYYMVDQSCDVITAVKHCFARRPIMFCTEYYVRKLIEFAEPQEAKELTADIADMEAAIIEKKRRLAVLTLNCDYEHLTKEDLYEIYQNAQQLVGMGVGVVHGDSYPLYAKICDKHASL